MKATARAVALEALDRIERTDAYANLVLPSLLVRSPHLAERDRAFATDLVYSVTRMPMGIYPEVTFPRVAVVAKNPGLDVVTTELQVTRPLELQASSVLGVRRVRSTTIRGGCDLSTEQRARR